MPNNSSDSPGRRIRYVCMPGSPFTGSTLLGALLNEHPACASIGAATGLIKRTDLSSYRCSCGERFLDCEFWKYLAGRTRDLGHPVDVFKTDFWNTHLRPSLVNTVLVRSLRWDLLNDARDFAARKLSRTRKVVSEAGWNSWSLASAVLERTGKQVFIDTARDHQRPKYLAKHPLLDVKVIHLVRDPRGNSASIMKHTGLSVAAAARQWKHYNTEADRVRRYLPQQSWLRLRYEELCADPAGVLDHISDFLGIDRIAIQQVPHDQVRHIIGNSMRLKGVGEIREDRSWQTRLSGADLDVIARVAGPTSRRLGFTWP